MPDAVLVRLTQKIVAVPIRIIIIIIYRDVVCAARGHQSLGSSEGVMCFLEATLAVRGVHFSSQNCIQAAIQSPRPLPHMNLNVSERLIWALRGMPRFTDPVTG